MNSLIMIIVSAAFINNVILSQFLGICSFLGVSNKIKTSASLGGAVIFVMTIASAVAYILYTFILAPLGLDYLQTIVFILVIAALVQIVEMFLKKTSPALYTALGIYLPLITTNCAVLGVALNNVTDGYDFIESVVSGFGTAVGYTIAIVRHCFLWLFKSGLKEAFGYEWNYYICDHYSPGGHRPGDRRFPGIRGKEIRGRGRSQGSGCP